MGYEYDLSLRERVLSYLEVGHGGKAEAAKVFGVARQTIYNWMKQKKTERASASDASGGTQAVFGSQKPAGLFFPTPRCLSAGSGQSLPG